LRERKKKGKTSEKRRCWELKLKFEHKGGAL